jgi:hypothetical protein
MGGRRADRRAGQFLSARRCYLTFETLATTLDSFWRFDSTGFS